MVLVLLRASIAILIIGYSEDVKGKAAVIL